MVKPDEQASWETCFGCANLSFDNRTAAPKPDYICIVNL